MSNTRWRGRIHALKINSELLMKNCVDSYLKSIRTDKKDYYFKKFKESTKSLTDSYWKIDAIYSTNHAEKEKFDDAPGWMYDLLINSNNLYILSNVKDRYVFDWNLFDVHTVDRFLDELNRVDIFELDDGSYVMVTA
ncbi:hypothetical protein WR164_02970 [Philodulcilactobacillus myokoensis]|uniref:Uncharacterized protein n=1 Tax=Philodulcilactobacillus myokoensis TaxID=2929573 RepID=A0A9W6B0R4_9LACO|nr:hypothetical protein [Philodulcilactobacillus myokoensis]GLB46318.1 hypothetical protein WR164_02970 [Philodulcilactobacillus myokoensis]